jgi:CheY-like chemotaxis protein
MIIADVRMPEMDGDVAVATICAARPTPFILVSAYSKPVKLDGQETIGRVYLTKPVKSEDLKNAINMVWSQNGSSPS